MTSFTKLIGLEVVAIKGRQLKSYKKPSAEVNYVFFSDGETYMEFDEQDYYSYHDCASSARHINIYTSKEAYENLMKDPNIIDANIDI